jgi:hypothetical protein
MPVTRTHSAARTAIAVGLAGWLMVAGCAGERGSGGSGGSGSGDSAGPWPPPGGSAWQPGLEGPSAHPGGSASGGARPFAPTRTSAGWLVTVYYTAVERFHTDAPQRVTGCPRLACSHGSTDLGSYPASFVAAVHGEGTGRTTAGRYLNWSYDTGYWLDDAPRDTAGRPLRPFESAAADPSALAAGTRFTLVACGHDDDGQAIPTAVCDRLRGGRWTVTDEFTPGLGGDRHLDIYLGEETGPGFENSEWYTTLNGASVGY